MLSTLLSLVFLTNFGCNSNDNESKAKTEKTEQAQNAEEEGEKADNEQAENDVKVEAAKDDNGTEEEPKDVATANEGTDTAGEEQVAIEELNPEDIEEIEDTKPPEAEEGKKKVQKTRAFRARVANIPRNPIKNLDARFRSKAIGMLKSKAKKSGYTSFKKQTNIRNKKCTKDEKNDRDVCSADVTITFIKYVYE